MSRTKWIIAAAVGVVLLVVGIGVVVTLTSGGPTTPTDAMEAPHFVEEAAAAGVDHAYDGDWTFFVGGGVAAFDCNDDRKPDLYFAGGANPAGLYLNDSSIGGALRFTEVRDSGTNLTEVTGAYPVDLDSDGYIDLAVLRFGENILFRGLGECRFERANDDLGFDGGDEWTAGFSATWEGSNEIPTLAVGMYVELDEDGRQNGECSDNLLFRPDGATYADPTLLSPGWCTLSVLFSDWDRSGRRDLRVANDKHYYRDGEEQLWRIEDGQPPRLYTRDDGWKKLQIWGMGIASHDVTGDGFPEVFLTSQGDAKFQELTNGPAQPTYGDIAIRRGVTAHRPFTGGDPMPSTSWHPEFQDVNNDGFTDLFITKGNVDAMPEYAAEDPNNLLLGQPDGTFVESAVVAGVVHYDRSRGAALVDLNLDGMLDLVEVNRVESVNVWRNVGLGDAASPIPMGNWVAVQLEQQGVNIDAIGSWVEVRIGDHTMQQEVSIGGGHAGDQLGWIHFGVGPSDAAEIRVQWPDGEMGPWLKVEANRFITIERGREEAKAWVPEQS
ncbi:MAG: CRTAC1 family protein [Acidimicrobiia bacterium]